MLNDGIKYLVTIAVPVRFFPGYNLKQFEIVAKKNKRVTLSDVKSAAIARKYTNFLPVGIIEIGPVSIKDTVKDEVK